MQSKFLRRHQELQDAWSFWFSKPDGFSFAGGDYSELALINGAWGDRRWFSLASSPSEDELRFVINIEANDSRFKRELLQLEPGQFVSVSPPMGNFNVPNKPDTLLFIAGGIGITPFRSIILEEKELKTGHDIVLVYTARQKKHLFLSEIKPVSTKFFQHVISKNRLSLAEIRHLVPDLDTRLVYLAGPEPMMTQLHDQLLDEGHLRWRLRLSYFTGYNDI